MKILAATRRRRSATSAAGKKKEHSNHRRGMEKESQSNTESKSPAGSKSQSRPERNQRVGEELIVEHGIEITAVERRKKMAKEVESGGVETKEDERSTKKC